MSGDPSPRADAPERLMVAVSPAPQSAALVEHAARMAHRLGLPWLAVSVEPASRERAPEDAERVVAVLLLAERLGAETLVVRGDTVPESLLAVARARQVSRLIVGRPTHTPLRDRVRGSMLDALLRGAAGIEVLVTGEGEPPAPPPARSRLPTPWSEIGLALGVLALTVALGRLLSGRLDLVDQAMIHLLAVVLIASRVSRRVALAATLASVVSYDLFFVPPFLRIWVADLHFFTTFLVMGIVGLVVSALTLRVREQAAVALRRERRTEALYALTRAMAAGHEARAIARAAAEHSASLTGGQARVRLADELDWSEQAGAPAAPGEDRLDLPIPGPTGPLGTLELHAPAPPDPEQRQLLTLFAAATGAALERVRLADEARAAELRAELERVRSGLLSAVSHDLRTPLSSIVGGLGAVLDGPGLSPPERALLESTRVEAVRLSGLLQGLLDLTRLSSGMLSPRLEWWPATELISGARAHLGPALAGRPVLVQIHPPELELRVDGLLVGQLLENLLDNANKYSPPGLPIELSARREDGTARLEVRDRGPGVPEHARGLIFERFFRVEDGGRHPGAGLGLAICAAVTRVHGGRIRVEDRPDGPGACFVVELPSEGAPPQVSEELS